MIDISIPYVAIIAALMAGLSTAVGVRRGIDNVALGDGGSAPLFLAQRRFGNLSEYAAMLLLLLVLLELNGAPARWLHAYGIAIVVLRLLHPVALFDDMDAAAWRKAARFVSAAGTALLLVVGGGGLLLL